MTKREAIIDALNHKENDIIPFYAEFTMQAHERVAKYCGTNDFEKNLGTYMSFTQYYGWPTYVEGSNEIFKDDFGVCWDRSGVDKDFGMITSSLIEDIEDYDYVFPKINKEKLRLQLQESIDNSEDKFRIAGIGFSMFERSWSMCGMEEVFMAMLASADELEQLYNDIANYNLDVLDVILEFPFDGIYFGDDWGQQKGLMMGPKHWRNFIKPQMKKLYEKAKSKGAYVMQHSCGDIAELFPDLIEIGLDCYQTFQPEIYDIAKIKREYGKDLTFWGGISTQELLPFASVEEIKKVTTQIMKTMRLSGGYIAAPTHALTHDCPPENIMAMMEVFQNQDKYL